ncbi:hypothetical protein GW17_00061880 [Ensete ventricosum]|nr:hypothetical protein GW17_00061880 [Ensete ventricosum]
MQKRKGICCCCGSRKKQVAYRVTKSSRMKVKVKVKVKPIIVPLILMMSIIKVVCSSGRVLLVLKTLSSSGRSEPSICPVLPACLPACLL